jgi:hypothetical protein
MDSRWVPLSIGIVGILIVLGAVGLYSYTSQPTTRLSYSSSESNTSLNSTSQSAAPVCGYQNSTLPFGCWADYLGYVPAGYVPAPHFANAPDYPCPLGMNISQCGEFQQSCGNGICDPNETCSNCPIDCGAAVGQTCDPYTDRTGSPVGVCELNLNATVG